MTQHEINFRIDRYITILIGIVFLGALLAHVQNKDEADDRQARTHVAKQERDAAQPGTWARLDRSGK